MNFLSPLYWLMRGWVNFKSILETIQWVFWKWMVKLNLIELRKCLISNWFTILVLDQQRNKLLGITVIIFKYTCNCNVTEHNNTMTKQIYWLCVVFKMSLSQTWLLDGKIEICNKFRNCTKYCLSMQNTVEELL